MRLFVIKPICLKRAGKIFDLAPGAIVEIAKQEKAKTLIDSGYVRPLLPPDEAGKPVAAKIYSHILQDTVWLALDPAFAGDGDGIPVYFIEEIRMMRGADEHTKKLLHAIKKIGSQLVAVNNISGTLVNVNKIRRDSKCS